VTGYRLSSPATPPLLTTSTLQANGLLWENDHIIDLNSFVPSNSDPYLFEADLINDRGDIIGPAFLPKANVHQYLLVRCRPSDFEGRRESHARLPMHLAEDLSFLPVSNPSEHSSPWNLVSFLLHTAPSEAQLAELGHFY